MGNQSGMLKIDSPDGPMLNYLKKVRKKLLKQVSNWLILPSTLSILAL
jgi:hypothetical protein